MTHRSPLSLSGAERGVSHTIGYVILIGSIVIAVTAILGLGAPTLSDQQESEYMSNTERAFELFAGNIEQIQDGTAPARETEIRFQGGQINQTEESILTVDVTDSNGDTTSHTVFSTPITYTFGQSGLHYEFGAVIRTQSNTGFFRSQPPFDFTNNRLVLSPVTSSVQNQAPATTGSQRLIFRVRRTNSETKTITSDVSSVSLTLTSPRHKLWASYFNESGLNKISIDNSTNTIVYEQPNVDSIALRETSVSVNIIS